MQKKGKKSEALEPGAPDIAYPSNQGAYERQLSFIYAWFFETWERMASDDKRATHEARGELQTLLLKTVGQMLRLALEKKDSDANQWAGMMLGNIYASIGKHDEKLSKTNSAYPKEKNKIGNLRTDLLFPKPIGETVQRELKEAERWRRRLLLHKGCASALAAVKREIPKAYWPTLNLPEFSLKSEPKWWDFLWPLIKKHNPDLLKKLRNESVSDAALKQTARWATFRRQFRQHLQIVARKRTEGVL